MPRMNLAQQIRLFDRQNGAKRPPPAGRPCASRSRNSPGSVASSRRSTQRLPPSRRCGLRRAARRIVNVRIVVAAVVADPPLVDQRILARLDPVDAVLVLFDPDRAAGRAAGADAAMPPQEPDPLLIQKILVAQRPDRAEIDHVARELVVQAGSRARRRFPRGRRGR